MLSNINNFSFVEKIKSGDAEIISGIYDKCYKSTENLILNNSGSYDDAKDIFQEALIVLITNVKKPGFILSSSLNTYLYSISRNLWLKKLQKERYNVSLNDSITENLVDDSVLSGDEDPSIGRVNKLMKKLSAHCKTLIRKMFYENSTIDGIMQFFGYKNKHTAVNQKYKCLEQVRKAAEISS